MAQAKFWIWRSRYIEGKCVITAPEGVDKHVELSRGVSRAAGWPANVICPMDPEYPKDIELVDNLYGSTLTVISARMRDSLDAMGVKNVEYLPVQIQNHKKKNASKDYFILNPPGVVDCIDLEASEVTFNPIKKDLISRLKRLVIDEDKVPASVAVFRPKLLPIRILVRDEIVRGLERAKLTGLHFQDPATHRGT